MMSEELSSQVFLKAVCWVAVGVFAFAHLYMAACLAVFRLLVWP